MSTKSPLNVPPAPNVRFRDYLLENVYLRTTRTQRAEILKLWTEAGAISDSAEAERRCHEAVFLVRAASREVAGVSTVGFMRVCDGRIFYAYRMFLRRADRVPYLMLAVVLATRNFLSTFRHPRLRPAGMLHVNENPKLMRPAMRKLFERVGYRYWGQTSDAEDVWAVEFDGSEPPRQARWSQLLTGFTRWRQSNRIPVLDLIRGIPNATEP